jgi:CheY-like chemotaxis protein
VLVVDDEPTSRAVVVEMLRPSGCQMTQAPGGADALEILETDARIDAVLLDKTMPGMDGYEVIRRVRQMEHRRDVPILVVTAAGLADEPARALSAGGNGYVPKPVNAAALFAELRRVAGRGRHDAPSEPEMPAAPTVPPDDLVVLPDDVRHAMTGALRRGDIQTLHDLARTLEGSQPQLAARIRGRVDAYDYDALRRLIAPMKGNPS